MVEKLVLAKQTTTKIVITRRTAQWTVNGATLETGEHVRDHVVAMELNQELDLVTDLLLPTGVKIALVKRQSTKIVSMIIAQWTVSGAVLETGANVPNHVVLDIK